MKCRNIKMILIIDGYRWGLDYAACSCMSRHQRVLFHYFCRKSCCLSYTGVRCAHRTHHRSTHSSCHVSRHTISQIYYQHQPRQMCKVSQCQLKMIREAGQTSAAGIINVHFKYPHVSSEGASPAWFVCKILERTRSDGQDIPCWRF